MYPTGLECIPAYSSEANMIDPQEAKEILSEHFEQLTLEEFNELRNKYVGETPPALVPKVEPPEPWTQILYSTEAVSLSLNAYLATALTTLTSEQRGRVDSVSDIAELVCQDLGIELYQPRNATDPVNHPEVSSEEVFSLDKERVLSSDLVIHVADYASTGSGEELDFALNALIPIVLIAHGESKVSRMVTGIPGFKLTVKYHDLDDLSNQLWDALTEIRPVLEQRKLIFSDFDRNLVGNKVRVLREDLRLTREAVASKSDDLLSQERIFQIENNLDSLSNPSLLELRYLATILKTTVADLVEPDLGEHVIKSLKDLMLGRVEARYGTSAKDQKQLLRHVLYRILPLLDQD